MIAITYDKESNSVWQHFGRTEYFYLFNEETGEEKIIDNGGYSHHDLAPYLKSLGVTTLICGGIGYHGVEAVQSAGIKLIPGAFGNVKDVINAFKDGSLVGNPNAMHSCSHNGEHHHNL
ncbi:MAG: NifB/NifX family molybdenum-iron cluster-binding protein [Candidatus Caccosoma sp.]|nr:NifB/NifX family molybdenum-iron cluster-binding protein [Candidatus Caccosoma sp.]